MKGGENKTPKAFGYTIIEVMIFLAISGLTFVLAASFISGKQQKAQFTQGMHSITATINGVMNDVYNGTYPELNNYSGGSLTFCQQGAAASQGANTGCVLMGKVMQFAVNGSGDSANGWTKYNVFTVAGKQFADANNTVVSTDFHQAQPEAVTTPPLTQTGILPGGIVLTNIYDQSANRPAGCPANPSAIGFFGSFGSLGTDASGGLASGNQSVIVTCIPGSARDNSATDIEGDINNFKTLTGSSDVGDNSILYSPKMVLCFASGGQKASVTIGGDSGQQVVATLQMGQGGTPC